MAGKIEVRDATTADAPLLRAWRNDPETRRASHNPAAVGEAEHTAWPAASLASPDRLLLVAQSGDEPVGVVRADRDPGADTWELSWTVAPAARGRGVAKAMVRLLADRLPGPLRAEVRAGNTASIRVAEHAGLTLDREHDGVLHFRRPARA